MARKFRTKPAVIEAVQWTGTNTGEIIFFLRSAFYRFSPEGDAVLVKIPGGSFIAQAGDWIIKSVDGEFNTVKPDIFEATYEEVENG